MRAYRLTTCREMRGTIILLDEIAVAAATTSEAGARVERRNGLGGRRSRAGIRRWRIEYPNWRVNRVQGGWQRSDL
jgi:hypothetical protein